MWINSQGQLYEGDCIVGDRQATAEEVSTWNAPTQAQIIAQYETALDSSLDSVAMELRFKDRYALALRAAYPNAWQELGLSFAQWMDGCNVQAYALMAAVLAGTKPLPSVESFISGLPEFTSPITQGTP